MNAPAERTGQRKARPDWTADSEQWTVDGGHHHGSRKCWGVLGTQTREERAVDNVTGDGWMDGSYHLNIQARSGTLVPRSRSCGQWPSCGATSRCRSPTPSLLTSPISHLPSVQSVLFHVTVASFAFAAAWIPLAALSSAQTIRLTCKVQAQPNGQVNKALLSSSTQRAFDWKPMATPGASGVSPIQVLTSSKQTRQLPIYFSRNW